MITYSLLMFCDQFSKQQGNVEDLNNRLNSGINQILYPSWTMFSTSKYPLLPSACLFPPVLIFPQCCCSVTAWILLGAGACLVQGGCKVSIRYEVHETRLMLRGKGFWGLFYYKALCLTAGFSGACNFSKLPPKIRLIQNMKILKYSNKMLTKNTGIHRKQTPQFF